MLNGDKSVIFLKDKLTKLLLVINLQLQTENLSPIFFEIDHLLLYTIHRAFGKYFTFTIKYVNNFLLDFYEFLVRGPPN